MLGRFFKHKDTVAPQPAEVSEAATVENASAVQQAELTVQWEAQLQAALGNDTALLELAQTAPLVDIKCAAVQAIQREEVLKQAERALRDRDRRVHRVAKACYQAQVARRKTYEQAMQLIATARTLLNETLLPVNRVVALEHAWQALDVAHLAAAAQADFTALLEQLTTRVRAEAAQQIQQNRWQEQIQQAITQLHAANLAAISSVQEQVAASAALVAARACAQTLPVDVEAVALHTAIQCAEQMQTRFPLLTQLQQLVVAMQTAANAEVADMAITELQTQWRALAPVGDTALDAALAQHWTQLYSTYRSRREQLHAATVQAISAQQRATRHEQIAALTATTVRAEAALTEGQLAELQACLSALDIDLTSLPKALQQRIQKLRTEYARLKGWQQWGGGRVRDDLVQEAETLAAAVTAQENAAPHSIKQLTADIKALRQRWRQLNQLGGASNQLLWERFDTALKTAYQPIATHRTQLAEVRQENLATRQQLLEVLDAIPLSQTPAATEVSVQDLSPELDVVTLDGSIRWKEIARALDHFHTQWRQLGPIAHTVALQDRAALLEKRERSVARLAQPLQQTRRFAQAQREKMIVRAQALLSEASGRDVAAKAHALQTEWQQLAQHITLERAVEQAQWGAFKTAIDAVFAQREAHFNERAAVLTTHKAARIVLIERLEQLQHEDDVVVIQRIGAEVAAAWREAGEVAKADQQALEQRFRAARQAAQRQIDARTQQQWQALCDALLAKLTLCVTQVGTAVQTLEAVQWAALPTLPAPWEQLLVQRFTQAETEPALTTAAVDDALLQLELILKLASPPQHAEALRELKLKMMKAALEAQDPVQITVKDLLTTVLSGAFTEQQHARFALIVAAVRAAGASILERTLRD